jgi:hypothetical protein
MTSEETKHILEDSIRDYGTLSKERDEIDARLTRLRRFISAALDMLAEADRGGYQAEFAAVASQTGSLTDSIRETLKLATQKDSYLTAGEVRDYLKNSGFDFSQYTSNPLSSVNTILRRFKPDEVETSTRDGVKAFRWAAHVPRLDKQRKPQRLIEVQK